MQTDHNLLQSGELKWNLLKIGTKDLNFQILMLIRKHCNPLCNLIHAYVNEKKIKCQIGTIIPMVLAKAFHSNSLFLVFVITLFPAVI